MTLPRYPAYKDSGLEWLGEVPRHWSVTRLRFVVELNPSKSEISALDRDTEISFLPMEAIGDDGNLDLARTRPLGQVESGYTYFREGDVTVAKITPCFENGKGAVMRGLKHGIGFGTTELIVARPRSAETVDSYVHWVFVSRPFRMLGESYMYGAGGQKRVPDDFVRNFAIGLPPLGEQNIIASFLDHETSKIDALIAEQKNLIALLKEKRQAVISHAVTKGLDPDVPMKDSGVEWLGEVPEHWAVGPMKRFANVIDCKHVTVQFHNEGWPVVSIRELQNDQIDLTNAKRTSRAEWDFLREGRTPVPYDLIFSRNASVGAVGQVEPGTDFCMGQDVCLIRPGTLTKYLYFQLTSDVVRKQIEALLVGATIRRMNVEEIRNLCVAWPNESEQRQIADQLDVQASQMSELIQEAQSSISLLLERRSALISAAVTGKIDVRCRVAEEAA